RGLTREDFLRFLEARYRPDRVLIAAAGNLVHEDLLAVAGGKFGTLSGSSPPRGGGPPPPHAGGSVHPKPVRAVPPLPGRPGIAHADAERYPANLLNLALGGGMSSRLFQEIRERRGKAYTVYSFLSSYLDAGYFGVYVGTSAEWLREVVDVIRKELDRVAR